jgi:hypothetical protein
MVHFAGECRWAHVGLAPRLDLADMESVRQVAAWFISQVSVGGRTWAWHRAWTSQTWRA